MKKIAEALVLELQTRKLYEAPGFMGYEGDSRKYDDWLLVDCYNIVVHLMLPETRDTIDLEGHWSAESRQGVSNQHLET